AVGAGRGPRSPPGRRAPLAADPGPDAQVPDAERRPDLEAVVLVRGEPVGAGQVVRVDLGAHGRAHRDHAVAPGEVALDRLGVAAPVVPEPAHADQVAAPRTPERL